MRLGGLQALILIAPLSLAGCMTSWPQQGTGGMAERQQLLMSAPMLAHSQRLDRLYSAGGQRLAAAQTAEAQQLLTTAQRLEAAGMCENANATLAELRVVLMAGEQRARLVPPFMGSDLETVPCG
jgi:hypothetical protein